MRSSKLRLLVGTAGVAAFAACASSRIVATPAARGDIVTSMSGGDRELDGDQQAVHVLNRLAFGPRPGDVDRVKAMGVDRWIAQQLRPEKIGDGAMDTVLAAYPTLQMSAGDLLRQYPRPGAKQLIRRLRGDSVMSAADSGEIRRDAQRNRAFVTQLMSARVARAIGSERQLQEVVTDFWLNHFSLYVGKGMMRYYLPDYERETIRPHALGKFRDLLGAVARSPAMLVYLDNAQSVADSGRPTLAGNGTRRGPLARGAARRLLPTEGSGSILTPEQRGRLAQLQARRPKGINENYARELLELHTLGVDGGYTQRDIIQVARALTGWTIRAPRQSDGDFFFNAAAHDAGEKEVLGHRLAAGRGVEDGEQVLDILARHPSTATFIARKLAVRLVSDTPSTSLVDRAAATFRRTDGDIREVVRTIVTSPEFFARSAYRSKVKSPFEVVVSAMRSLGARPDTTPAASLMVARLGQPIYGHQAPNGWPEIGDAWMNTGAILARINFGLVAAAGRLPGSRVSEWPEYERLKRATREAQVDQVVTVLLGGSVSRETRDVLLSGENPMLKQLSDSVGARRHGEDSLEAIIPIEGAESKDVGRRSATMGPPPRENGGSISPTPRNPDIAGVAMPLRPRAFGAPPQLSGLAQIIGLALGSPEFQRR